MLSKLLSFIKYFFIALGSIVCLSKVLNRTQTKKEFIKAVFFCLFTAPIIVFVREKYLPLTVYFAILCLVIYFFPHTPSKNYGLILFTTLLSFGINYAISMTSLLITAPFFYFIFPKFADTLWFKLLTFFLSSILHIVLLLLFFHIPRFKNGIPEIEKNFSDEIGFLISIPLLFISSLLYVKNTTTYLVTFAVFLTISFGIIIFFWWRKYLSNNYIRRAQNQTIAILEKKIEEQKNEIEDLSKIIHKDNKLVSALYLSVQKLCSNPDKEHAERLKQELEPLAQERKGMIQRYEAEDALLQKTKVFSTDVILSYLFQRASEQNINFSVTVTGDIRYMTENIIDENLLNTLLADLGENAVIATKKSDTRNILLSLGVRDGYYYVDVFDSGLCFEPEVIKHLGKARYTTHKEEGGSGIGLMTTFEILRKQNGSFEIEEFADNSMFTKRVSVLFDGQGNILISCLQTVT